MPHLVTISSQKTKNFFFYSTSHCIINMEEHLRLKIFLYALLIILFFVFTLNREKFERLLYSDSDQNDKSEVGLSPAYLLSLNITI